MLDPVLIFDYDDTLGGVRFPDGTIHTAAAAYDDCIERFVQFVESRGLDGARARQAQHEIDMQLAAKFGFADKTRFAESMRLVYALLASYGDHRGQREAYDIGMSVFSDYVPVPLPNALKTLETLRDHNRIVVVTKGAVDEQERKLQESGVAPLVDRAFVVARKDDAEWDEVLKQIGFRPDDFLNSYHGAGKSWAIGNSPKSDVNPLVRRGFNGILLSGTSTWAFEHEHLASPHPHRYLHVVSSIEDILPLLPIHH